MDEEWDGLASGTLVMLISQVERASLPPDRPIILVVTRKLACALLALSCLTACVDGVSSEARGIWLLTAFDGNEVEPGLTTTGTPWVEIGEGFDGNTGCNDFSAAPDSGAPPYRFEDEMLFPAEVFQDLMSCEPNDAEVAFARVFGPDGIEVTIEGDMMRWHGNGARLEFIRAEGRPPGS